MDTRILRKTVDQRNERVTGRKRSPRTEGGRLIRRTDKRLTG